MEDTDKALSAFTRKALSATPDKISWSNVHNDHWLTTLEAHGEDKLYYISEERGHKLNAVEALEMGFALTFLAHTVYDQPLEKRFIDVIEHMRDHYELQEANDQVFMPTENFSFILTEHLVYVTDRNTDASDLDRRKIRFPAVILLEEAEMFFSVVHIYVDAANKANS